MRLTCVRLTCVLAFFGRVVSCSNCVDQPCDECRFFFKVGDECKTHGTHPVLFCDHENNSMRQTASSFLECVGSKMLLRECKLGSYYEDGKGCVDPTSEPFMQGLSVSGSGRVGDVCQYNTDCLGGMYCSGGLCTCLSTYIMREYYCYEKVNPNQPGCTYDVQCEAVWPGAKCRMDSSVGTCRCPEETHVARETRDGWVCVSLKDSSTGATVPLYFVCPLPEGAGFKIALNDPNPVLGSLPVGCTVGSSATVEPVVGLHGGGSCIWPSEGEYVGDIYDCIHTSPHVNLATKFPLSSYAPSADGVCCPSRALACIQPQMTGPNPTEPRWWYNSVTGTCQQFMWDSTASDAKYHSANNFRTIQHCESYCRDTCQRGSPQYSSEHTVNVERPVTSCSSSASCSSDFQCSSIGSQNLCCPTPASVCSARGGRPFDIIPRSSIYHVGFLVTTGKETIRFYYDTSTGRCQDFVYRGAGGNFNNFLSRHECELYCSRLQCERGSPLRIGEEAQHCQHNGQCPSSHECRVDQGVCCPRKQTICAQPLRVGDCTENVKRYWYNSKARQCQMFEYTGCQGNDNNFETVLDCQSFCKNAIPEPKCIQGQAYRNQFGDFVTCNSGVGCPSNYECYYDGDQWGCCPTKAFTCYSNADSGMQCGSGSTFRFYYNVQTQNCESFQYNGCDGNSNNFANRDQCEQYCGVGGCPYGGSPFRDHSGMIAICTTKDSCPSSHECSPVLVGASSVTRCCPKREHMCGLPPQQGTQCGANFVTRFYFNIVTGQCTSFLFGGCDGNYNNFLTIQQCRNFCYSSSCPAGNAAYVDPNSQVPIQCNEALSNSCPSGYSCTFNALINGHVCCGASDNGVCPENEKAFISTTDMSPRECIVNMDASCPANYLCRFSMQRNKYFCCTSVSGRTCPVGKFLHKDSQTSLSTRCTMGRAEQCPDGYSCQSYLANAAQGFCCTSSSVCPDEAEFVVDEHSQLPRACTMGSFVGCPNGFTCRSLTSAVEGFCCRSGSSAPPPLTDGCPPGNYVFMKDGLVVACDPFNPPNAPCPDGFTCQWSIANQKYQCCGSNPAPPSVRASDGCPNAQLAFKDKGTVRVCTAGSSTCPPGYFCQFSSLNRQFQCCGVSGGCPGNSVAFVGLSGEPEKCVVGQSKCPVGFMCQRSIAGENFCCTVKHEICSNEEVTLDGICLRRVKPGGVCLKSEQCSGGATCHRGVCECPASTSSIGGFCQQEIKCSSEQVQHGGLCYNKVELSKPCSISQQCPSLSSCVQGVCECNASFVSLHGKCVTTSAQLNVVRGSGGSSKCADAKSKPLLSEETGRAVFCSPKTKQCPYGYSCQINSRKTQYICCSDSSQHTQQVCPSGRVPYLLNGRPQRCTTQRCPRGYECTYKDHSYICCSSVGNDSKRLTTRPPPTNDYCPHGSPLIYPSTRMPVVCTPEKRACPAGYACKKSPTSEQYICCSSRFRMSAFPGSPCDGYLVLVSRIIGGRIEERCASSSHKHQRPERQTGSGRVGDACVFNTDCLTGMFCNSGQCACLSSYIAAESYCYQKIDPGQPGCTYDEQCSSVWPDAFCDNSAGVGTCRCGENKVERATRDGHVCLDMLDANQNVLAITCPLPEGAGYTSALSDSKHPRQANNPGPVLCNTESLLTHQSGEEAGDGSAGCLFPSDGAYVADLYDCVGFVSSVDLTSSGYSDKANGICCPNRAFTCIQPTATGPNPTDPRWWYNAITGMCQQFLWDPTAVGPGEHSPNNFKTIEHCESFCRDACVRGAPEYESRSSFLEETPLTGCSQSTSCSNNFECKTVGSSQWCCPSVASVCGPVGGRPQDTSIHIRGSVYHVGVEKQGTAPSTRFFYDPNSGKCSPFTYLGAAGNYNNFVSRIDCELYCARLQCDRGNPLRIGDITQACQSNNDCPSSHECRVDQAVCCPRMQTICSQPLRVGNCDRSVRRYWYSAATRECQSFEYTGCQGNDNNFETLVDCQTFCRNAAPEPRCLQGQAYKDNTGKFVTCSTNRAATSCPVNYECHYDGNIFGCCPSKAFTCSLAPNQGKTCGPGVSFKFFYNPQSQECESFEYLGCDGNSNTFASRQECESYCGVGGCTNGGVPLRDSSGALQTCSEKSGGCPSTHECHAVSLSPGTVAHRCCPSKTYICGLPPQQGSSLCSGGSSVITRYYFNIVTKKCSPFTFNGCDGNPNNFPSLTQCNNFCLASACSAGDVVYVNPNTQTPISCNDEIRNNCPKNFQCVFDSLTDMSVCCGATDMGVCPEGEKAYISAADMSVRECLINEPNSCPTNYLCRFNASKNRYFCCGSTKRSYCPTGRAPYKDQMSAQAMRCTMSAVVSTCPDGFECQSDVKDALQGYCCSVSDICPNKEEYYVDESSEMPRSCSIGHFVTCPAGFTCMTQSDGISGYCCRGKPHLTPSDGCPPGEIVYMDKNEVVVCDPFNLSNQGCPSSFTCQWSVRTQRYQCCGANPIPPSLESDGCPSRQIAFIDVATGKPQICTSASMSCPIGYFCQFSQQHKQFQCCGIPSDCPAPMVAFIGISGEHQRCSMSGGQICPEGFSCVKGKRNEDICCAGSEACESTQVSVNGRCLPIQHIGSKCEHKSQCLGDSTCTAGVCRCPTGTMEQNQRCVEAPKECAINQVEFIGECLPIVSLGRACVQSIQCRGGGYCVEGVCDCPSGTVRKLERCEKKVLPVSSTSRTTSSHPTIDGSTDVKEENAGLCPTSRLPYVINGTVKSCVGGRSCPAGYTCTFSKAGRNYFCCSNSIRSIIEGEVCKAGKPLLYPKTGQPVTCSRIRECPAGYSCKRNLATQLFHCCTTPKPLPMDHYINQIGALAKKINAQKRINFLAPPQKTSKRSLCPTNLVLFEVEVESKLIRRCQASCPSAMSVINGVCRSRLRENPLRQPNTASAEDTTT